MEEVIFRAVDGALKDEEFVFDEKGLCLIGRSNDCALHIPKEKDMRISRRHCLLILDPPKVKIRDLGSRNGTMVNGELLPSGVLGDVPEQPTPADSILNDGDIISIGETVLEVIIPSSRTAAAAAPPPGTKVIKLAKPEKPPLGVELPKSAPVNTGFFIAPVAKGKPITTSTAPLTEAFLRPEHGAAEPPAPVAQPAEPSPGATLILRAKPQSAPEEAAAAAPAAPQAVPDQPKKVLKAKIVKKSSSAAPPPANKAPQQGAASTDINPDLTEVMDISQLDDDIKLSADYIKKQKKNKRVTKFRVKGSK